MATRPIHKDLPLEFENEAGEIETSSNREDVRRMAEAARAIASSRETILTTKHIDQEHGASCYVLGLIDALRIDVQGYADVVLQALMD
jgi:beta-glucosidase-like glycosyl hydrolase